jgi:hypothetical protein
MTHHKKVTAMQWTMPEFEELTLNCEINFYASAEM